MSETEKRLEELEKLVEKSLEPKPSVNWSKYLSVVITVLVLGTGIVVSWATQRVALAEVQKDIVTIVARDDKQQNEIQEIKLKAVSDSSDIKHIKEKVDSIERLLQDTE